MSDRGSDAGEVRYNMDYPSMGTCIIISNKNFKSMPCLGGNDVDAAAAAETFTRLGYEVKVEKDLKASQMNDLLKKVSQEDHSCSASFVCVMSTHGDEGNIYGTDGVVDRDNKGKQDGFIELKELAKMFRGDRCKSLVGKPKLFFIQACRGSDVDDGIESDSVPTEARIDQSETCRIPLEADFLYAYSTVEGYMSWMHCNHGGWFMQTLCKMLKDSAKDLTLMQMLTRVNGKVSQDFEYASKRQMPSIVYMLTKELYFTRHSPRSLDQ